MARNKMRMKRQCGCRVVRKNTKRGQRYMVKCPGTPMTKFVSKEDGEEMQGRDFCTEILTPT